MSKVLNRNPSDQSIGSPQSQFERVQAAEEGKDLLRSIVASAMAGVQQNKSGRQSLGGEGNDQHSLHVGGNTSNMNAPSPSGYFNLVVDPNDESLILSRPNPTWSPGGPSILSAAARSPCPVTADNLPSSEQFQKQSEALAFSFQNGPSLSRRGSAFSPGESSQLKAMEDLPVPSGSISAASIPAFSGSFKLSMPNSIAMNGRASAKGGMSLNLGQNDGPVNNLVNLNLYQSKGMGSVLGSADMVEFLPNIEPEKLGEVLQKHPDKVLLLDLRSSAFYNKLRIKGSVNLCLPTTLMKRPSFNVSKLTEALPNPREKDRLSMWKDALFIIVYDASDSVTAAHTIGKFKREGWKGKAYLLSGGFNQFASKFPDFIEDIPDEPVATADAGPITGARIFRGAFNCPLPKVKTDTTAFFQNIRQNTDLVDGVGELPISIPEALTKEKQQQLPAWLKRICTENGSKILSQEFWQIEKAEQKRMQIAWGTAPPPEGSPTTIHHQLAGIERGDKNRYKDIYPYDHSRVKLAVPQKDHGDYINASHLSAHHSAKRYIATQAPLPSTFIDFWSLVWEQDVRVIVMLTAEMEGGTMKCHPYWKDPQYGPFELMFLNENRVSLEQSYSTQDNKRHSGPNLHASKSPTNEDNVPHIVVRRFFLKHTAHPFAPGREITQLQYSHWPDFGAPAHPAHILGLVEHTDAVVRACSPSKAVFAQDALANVPQATINTRPVLVHCSAGCGRTGAFCTVDSVIGMLRRQRFHKQFGYSLGSDELEVEGSGSRSSSRGSNNRPSSPTSSPTTHDNAWLEREDEDLIADAVHDFRKQRLSMVQSLRQYVLCYETVLEWIARQKPLDSAKRKAL